MSECRISMATTPGRTGTVPCNQRRFSRQAKHHIQYITVQTAMAKVKQMRWHWINSGHNTTSENGKADTPQKAWNADYELQVCLLTDGRTQTSGWNWGQIFRPQGKDK